MSGSMTLPRRGPRFSIVPPQVAYDTRLDAIDVRMLLVFGTHIDNDGWCCRSQVRMARELKVGRATVQRSIERLVRAGYLEYRATLNKVGGDGSHLYRVHFDAAPEADFEDEHEPAAPLPASGQGVPDGAAVRAKIAAGTGGYPMPGTDGEAGRGVPAHGMGTPCPPMERAPLERPLTNGFEREARTGEGQGQDDLTGLDEFRAVWPTAAFDSRTKTERAWAPLSAADRKAATAHAPDFLAGNRASGRRTTPSAATYLTERSWELLAKPGPGVARASPGRRVMVKRLSKEWWGVTYRRAETGGVTKVMFDAVGEPQDWGVDAAEIDPAFVESLKGFPVHGPELERWRPWFAARGVRLPAWRDWHGGWVFLPDHAPPGFGGLDESDDDVAAAMGAG